MSKLIHFHSYLKLIGAEEDEIDVDGVGADEKGLFRSNRYNAETLRGLTPEEREALEGGPIEWPSEGYALRFPCTLEELRRALGTYADAIDEDIAAEYEPHHAATARSSSEADQRAPAEALPSAPVGSQRITSQPNANAKFNIEATGNAPPAAVPASHDVDETTDAEGVESVATATASPIDADTTSANPAGVPKQIIAAAFGEFELNDWDEKAWSRNLGDGRSAWLRRARITKGRRGVRDASTWNPIAIALYLRFAQVAWFKLDAIFKKAAFREWRDQWMSCTELMR